jgi:iron complex outermembrane receptor protein
MHFIRGFLLVALAAGIWGHSVAQESTPDSSSAQIAEIVVTAQRRTERAQDVPISIDTIDAHTLTDAHITNALELSQVVPAVNIQYGTGTYTPFIRGIGNPIAVAGNEASVSTYVDGFYIARVFADFLPLEDMERIEVLKGPQGTLFGRNSTGGLINLITRTPERDPTIEGSVGYGNYGTTTGKVYASAPLGSLSAVSLSAFGEAQDDPWGHNVTTGQDVGRGDKYRVRGKFVSSMTDTTNITLSAGYVHAQSNFTPAGGPAIGTTTGNPPGFPPQKYQPLGFFDVRGNSNPETRAKSFDASLRIDQGLGALSLVSLTGYRNSRIFVFNDYDYTPLNYFNATLPDKEKQVSEEIQLLSAPGSRFNWITGLYYLHLESAYDGAIFSGSEFGGVNAVLYGAQDTDSYSAYAQGTYEIVPKLKLTLGGRYTRDDVSGSGRTDIAAAGDSPFFTGPLILPGATTDVNRTFDKFTYRAALDFSVLEDILLYASVSSGFKSGVITTLPINPQPAQPEVVKAYELGIKSELFERKVRLNAAVFQMDITDPQVQRIVAATNEVVNAKGARSRGIEVELEAAVAPGLEVRASSTYLDAKYTDFQDAPYTTGTTQLVNGIVPGCNVPATGNIDPANGGNVAYCPGNASGNRMSRAPKVTGSLGLNWSVPMGARFQLRLAPSLSYNSGFFWDPDNRTRQPAYSILNMTATVATVDNRWALRAWASNLTNKRYYAYVAEQGDQTGNSSVPAAPVLFGAAIDFKF